MKKEFKGNLGTIYVERDTIFDSEGRRIYSYLTAKKARKVAEEMCNAETFEDFVNNPEISWSQVAWGDRDGILDIIRDYIDTDMSDEVILELTNKIGDTYVICLEDL